MFAESWEEESFEKGAILIQPKRHKNLVQKIKGKEGERLCHVVIVQYEVPHEEEGDEVLQIECNQREWADCSGCT